MTEQWKKEMQGKLAEFGQKAPEVSWEEIGRLAKADGRRRRVVPVLVRSVAAAAAVVAVVGIGFGIFRNGDAMDDGGAVAVATITPDRNENPVGEPVEPPAGPSTVRQNQGPDRTGSVTVKEGQLVGEFVGSPVGEPVEPPAGPSTVRQNQGPDRTGSVTVKDEEQYWPVDWGREPEKTRRLTARAYVTNSPGSSESISAGKMDGVMMMDAPYANSFEDMGLKRHEAAVSTEQETHHHRPLGFGLTFNYALGGRWSVESGLTYSLLISDFSTATNGYSNKTEQRLSYVGIPLNLAYRIAGSGNFGLYASAGGKVEKMVKGTATTRTLIDGTSSASDQHGVTIRPLQYSVNASIGAGYRLGRNLSIFAEPGVRYSFDNGSDVKTVYKDRPLDFNMSLGLRFNL